MISYVKCPLNFVYLPKKMMIPRYELIHFNDKLYYVYRRVPENQIKEGKLNDLKEYWMCDLVVRNKKADDNILTFLREIPDAEIIEDAPDSAQNDG